MKKPSTFHPKLHSLREGLGVGIILSFLLWSCKPAIPKGILKPSKMESLLYDYHYAENLPYKGVQPEVARELYTQSVLEKHKVSPQQFQTSLAYYSRHADKLLEIYKHLDERYTEQSLALGGNVATQSRKTVFNSSDTADVWQESPDMLLFPYKPRQSIFFDIPIDTAHHAGDTYQLEFNTRYIYPDGQKSSVVLLCLVLNNDSTIVAQTQPSSSGHFQIRVSDTKALGIKRLCGYMLLNPTPIRTSQSLFRALLIENIQLLRMHNVPSTQTPSPAGGEQEGAPTQTDPSLEPRGASAQNPPLRSTRRDVPTSEASLEKIRGVRGVMTNSPSPDRRQGEGFNRPTPQTTQKLPPRKLQSPKEMRSRLKTMSQKQQKRKESLKQKTPEKLPPLPPKNNGKLPPLPPPNNGKLTPQQQ